MGEMTKCPICKHPGIKQTPQSGDTYLMQCRRCGKYKVTWEFLTDFDDINLKLKDVGYLLSGLSRELNETTKTYPLFTVKNIETTPKHYLIPNKKSIDEKIQKFLQRVRERTNYFGEEIQLGEIETVVPLAYAKNSEELMSFFRLMTEKKIGGNRRKN
jgi:hypothetical protein